MTKLQEQEKGSVQKALLDEKKSAYKKYLELFVGKKSLWYIIKYESIIFLFSWIPGALGLFLRKLFYPMILGKVGKGVVFGHHITLRHPHKTIIDDNSFVDDYAVLDAKGEEDKGIILGKNVIIGRNTILSCKGGSIELGDYVNISAGCSLLSETIISVGAYTFLAGHCYLVAGGNHSISRTDIPIMFQPSLIKGGIQIEEDSWLGASVVVLDGITLGKGCVVGAGAVVTESFPDYSVIAGIPAKKIKSRKG
ncbi:MAG: acyltransferase [Candidatus Aminicenantes bacterium]|nr:MAG: acyltransferase [Candidatus Aminicenantes bacterium]